MRYVLGLSLLAALAGCSDKTETGYTPRKLGDSLTVQRGYYAQPFSPEERAARQEQQQGSAPSQRPDFMKNY
ncbi:MAG: hypothetical protein ABSH20_09505 [Tepidisphaeraceae bacterium]|jgi:hypothetical protein